MKILGFRKRFIVLSSIVLIFVVYLSCAVHMMRVHSQLHAIASCLLLYAQSNNGQFPPSEDALLESDLIKEVLGNAGKYRVCYYMKNSIQFDLKSSSEKLEWKIICLEKYKIQYAINIENIKERDGRIYTENEEPFFFIKGPCFFFSRGMYNSVSLDIYHVIKKIREN